MLILLIAFILSFIITIFLGYWVHRFIHLPIAGIFYKAHFDHHSKQYPENGQFLSDEYKDSGIYNSTYWFILLFSPLLVGLAIGMFIGFIPVALTLSILFGMTACGLLNSFLHDALHLHTTKWSIFPGFYRLQELHRLHHNFQKSNYGIFSFTLDKLFRTFKT